MKIFQKIALDFGRDTLPITVFAKQNDAKTRFLEISPLNNGAPYEIEGGVIARLHLTKADGHTVLNDAIIEQGNIIVELTEQALAAPGIATAEIWLYKGEALLSSQIFYIDVSSSAYDAKAPESSDEFNSLLAALAVVYNISATAESGTEPAAVVEYTAEGVVVHFKIPPGKTPQKGVDYFTEADITAFLAEVAKKCVLKSERDNVVYVRFGGKDTVIEFSSADGVPYSMTRRDSRGCIVSAEPKLDKECATKGYVDGRSRETVYINPAGYCVDLKTGYEYSVLNLLAGDATCIFKYDFVYFNDYPDELDEIGEAALPYCIALSVAKVTGACDAYTFNGFDAASRYAIYGYIACDSWDENGEQKDYIEFSFSPLV